MTVRAKLEAHAKACREAMRSGASRPTLPSDIANLSWADLSGAYLSGANLSGADLSGADLSGAYLAGADLSGANLAGADIRGANLRRADLFGADLFGANLRRADLFGADLFGADLRRADLSEARHGDDVAERIESVHYPCWRLGPWLAYGCECHRIEDWPLAEAAARHTGDAEAHAEVRAIVERLLGKVSK